jgi:hypothetical protein
LVILPTNLGRFLERGRDVDGEKKDQGFHAHQNLPDGARTWQTLMMAQAMFLRDGGQSQDQR